MQYWPDYGREEVSVMIGIVMVAMALIVVIVVAVVTYKIVSGLS